MGTQPSSSGSERSGGYAAQCSRPPVLSPINSHLVNFIHDALSFACRKHIQRKLYQWSRASLNEIASSPPWEGTRCSFARVFSSLIWEEALSTTDQILRR